MIIFYLIVVNIILFILMAYDKYCAIKNKSRIRERTFTIGSFLGGFIGLSLGMMVFNHKIRKSKFYIIIGFSIAMWIYIIYKFC